MKVIRLILLLLIIPIPSSLAEYRAYELVIEDADSGKQRTVVTTLDHLQYPTYYPLNQKERVFYVRSWMCWGTSDYEQDICPAPAEEAPERFPASQ